MPTSIKTTKLLDYSVQKKNVGSQEDRKQSRCAIEATDVVMT